MAKITIKCDSVQKAAIIKAINNSTYCLFENIDCGIDGVGDCAKCIKENIEWEIHR